MWASVDRWGGLVWAWYSGAGCEDWYPWWTVPVVVDLEDRLLRTKILWVFVSLMNSLCGPKILAANPR